MDYPCVTTYVIIGNQVDIKFLHKNLRNLFTQKQNHLRDVARTMFPHWTGYQADGYFCDLSLVNSRQITFKVITATSPDIKIWFDIFRKYQTVRCYYYAAHAHSNQYKTNDSSGKYFPARYMIVSSSGIRHSVVSHHEMYNTAARIVPVQSAFPTLEAFGQAISEHRGHISIYDIIVVDQRGKCLTPTTQMIGQYIQ